MNINQNSASNKDNSIFNKKYEHFFYELYKPLCIYCLTIIDDEEAAKDIVQDQFVNLWENWERLSKFDSISAYLYTAVRNRAINYKKKHSKNQNCKINDLSQSNLESNTDPHNLIENSELEKILERALVQLPKKCKEIFILKRFAELSNKEIAEKLNISVKTVENQMTIALKRIKEFVNKNWSGFLLLLNYFI